MSFTEVRVEEIGGGGGSEHVEQSRGSQGLKANITAWVLNKMKCFIDSPYKEVSGNKPTNTPKIPSFLLGPSDSDCSDPLQSHCTYLVVLFALRFLCVE